MCYKACIPMTINKHNSNENQSPLTGDAMQVYAKCDVRYAM